MYCSSESKHHKTIPLPVVPFKLDLDSESHGISSDWRKVTYLDSDDSFANLNFPYIVQLLVS
jgi:hypothetical protein